jgi:hypothetical protein
MSIEGNKHISIAYIGGGWRGGIDCKNDLLLRIIERVSGRPVHVVSLIKEADFVLVYPYIAGSLQFRIKWLVSIFLRKVIKFKDLSRLFRWMINVADKPILFVSHENLDRPYWWRMLGDFLVSSNIPRLTFWPHQIDPIGARFPYWYNYLDWDDYPRDNFYTRFGRLYTARELMSTLKSEGNRKDAVVVISSHLDYPRHALLNDVKRKMQVDVWGGAGIKFSGGKFELMQKYKYAFCPENSTGYGYDTEKLPEAWISGCVPVGIYLNPFSDFNPDIINYLKSDADNLIMPPLLLKKPALTEVESYVKKFLEKYLDTCTNF